MKIVLICFSMYVWLLCGMAMVLVLVFVFELRVGSSAFFYFLSSFDSLSLFFIIFLALIPSALLLTSSLCTCCTVSLWSFFFIIFLLSIPGALCWNTNSSTLLVTPWISDGYPVRIKCAGSLFKFHLLITLAVIWISRTVAGSKNWMSWKESLRVSSHFYIDYPRSKVTIIISIILVVTSLSIIIVFLFYIDYPRSKVTIRISIISVVISLSIIIVAN